MTARDATGGYAIYRVSLHDNLNDRTFFAPDSPKVGHYFLGSPADAKKSDYGVLVYGSPAMVLSASEAAAAKLGPTEMTLEAKDVADDKTWAEAFAAIMEARKATRAGDAVVRSGKNMIKLPYYVWEQAVLGQTRHALMYVVRHGDAFIYVQVESNKALSKQQQEWMASKLELL